MTTKTSILLAASLIAALSGAFAAPTSETLPSGVIVEHLSPGKGSAPKATDKVTVNYRGTLTSGVEFDSSYKRNAPATFPLNRVIPCWTEAVQRMKPGGKIKVTCPAKTAYGAASPSPLISPNSTLVFEIELLSIAQ